MHVETHTKKLDRRPWEGRLVGYSVDSKSFRVYNPATRSVRQSRNVIFIETPSVMPEPDLVSGFDERDFTYDEYNDMVRDVRNHTSNLDLSSPPAADREVQDPSVRDLLQTIRGTTNGDPAANRNSSDPPETPPVDNPSNDAPGGDSSVSPEQGSPTGSGGGSESHGSSGISVSGAASRGGRGSRGSSASRGGRGARSVRGRTAPRGGRGCPTPQRPTTSPVAQAPNARAINELRRLAGSTKGVSDIVYKDDSVLFVANAYRVKFTQPNVHGTLQEAMTLTFGEPRTRWIVSKTFSSTSWFLARQFLRGHVYTNRGGCSTSRLATLTRRAWWSGAVGKSQKKTAATPTLVFAEFRAFKCC